MTNIGDTVGPGTDVTVRGLKSLRRGLKQIGPEWPRELRKVNKEIADRAATLARTKATGMGGVHAKAAGAIKGYATGVAASVGVPTSGKSTPMAGLAFWGAKAQTGWYAADKFNQSTGAQHPKWVGASWEVAVSGQGPYAINDALADLTDELLEAHEDAIERLVFRTGAFDSPL